MRGSAFAFCLLLLLHQASSLTQEKIANRKCELGFLTPQEQPHNLDRADLINHPEPKKGPENEPKESTPKRDVASEYKNVCLPSGKSPKDFSSRLDYLKEFAKGPCNPMVLLPGILGSKLRIEIKCKEFSEHFPKLFNKCLWISCLKHAPTTPHSEYTVWVPGIKGTSKGFIFHPNSCLSRLLKLRVNSNFKPEEIISYKGPANQKPWLIDTWKQGFRIVPFGYSKHTRTYSQSRCGFKAMTNMISGIKTARGRHMKRIRDLLESMGYVSGLTMLGLPYDWRLHNDDDPVTKMIPEVLKSLKELTNKRVVIAAHSMGNLRALNAIYGMKPEFKDSHLKSFLSIAPPFMGVVQPILQFICGNEKLQKKFFKILKWGFSPKGFINLVKNIESMYQLMPNNSINLNRGKDWVKNLEEYIRYERKYRETGKSTEKKLFSWLPDPSEICYSQGDESVKNKHCKSGLDYYFDFGNVNHEMIYGGRIKDILDKYSVVSSESLNRGFTRIQRHMQEFPNPEVDTVLIYSNSVRTPRKVYIFPKEPAKILLEQQKYCEKGIDFNFLETSGDGTVDAGSSVTPFIKWGMEFDAQKDNRAKPVKIAELCSDYVDPKSDSLEKTKTPYDDTRKKITNKNGYIGLGRCHTRDKKGNFKSESGHTSMLENADLLAFLAETLLGEPTGGSLSEQSLSRYSSELLDLYVENCQMGYGIYNKVT